MRICKYCKKPISDNDVWNPDQEGNGYHHSCLCEIEFRSMDKQIYDKGRADVLDKIRAEIEQLSLAKCTETCRVYIDAADFKKNVLEIIDKYKAESEVQDAYSD